jgi:hypothetical protein
MHEKVNRVGRIAVPPGRQKMHPLLSADLSHAQSQAHQQGGGLRGHGWLKCYRLVGPTTMASRGIRGVRSRETERNGNALWGQPTINPILRDKTWDGLLHNKKNA